MDFFGDLGLRETFQERIVPKPVDRHLNAVYEIFSIERRFWQSKSRFSRLGFKFTVTVMLWKLWFLWMLCIPCV